MKLLTGENPGKRNKRGEFPKDSLYEKVEAQLSAFNEGFEPADDEEDE